MAFARLQHAGLPSQIDSAQFQGHLAGDDAREIEQLVDHLGQCLALFSMAACA